MLFKSNSSFPEIGQLVKSNVDSSGCLLLSILANVDYSMTHSSIKDKILRYNDWRQGKSNFSSMLVRWATSWELEYIEKNYSFFQSAIEKYSNSLKGQHPSSDLELSYN